MGNDNTRRTDRLQIMLTEEETRAPDDWRFSLRMPSRSGAVRELLRRGLAAEGYFDRASATQPSDSFGIVDHDAAPDRSESKDASEPLFLSALSL